MLHVLCELFKTAIFIRVERERERERGRERGREKEKERERERESKRERERERERKMHVATVGSTCYSDTHSSCHRTVKWTNALLPLLVISPFIKI